MKPDELRIRTILVIIFGPGEMYWSDEEMLNWIEHFSSVGVDGKYEMTGA